jgi:hypothetical protein
MIRPIFLHHQQFDNVCKKWYENSGLGSVVYMSCIIDVISLKTTSEFVDSATVLSL